KLSPMLDWHRAVEELKTVSEVHIVSVANECKELLLVVQKKAQKTRIFCVNDHQSFSYDGENNEKNVPCIAETAFLSEKNLLFLPNSSVMKAGCFAELCDRFHLTSLAPNSHLFVKIDESSAAKIDESSTEKIDDFPGKIFQISAISSMNKRDLRDKFKDIDRANIATRNFPIKPEELRRRLKLREGGDNFIFATTLADGKHVLILCKHAH
ncbi:MAG: SAM-dependent methyltransferase, partial [Prevotella sp.]|nr:SAM-dependent methyltransferase [Prevotella sp.]